MTQIVNSSQTLEPNWVERWKLYLQAVVVLGAGFVYFNSDHWVNLANAEPNVQVKLQLRPSNYLVAVHSGEMATQGRLWAASTVVTNHGKVPEDLVSFQLKVLSCSINEAMGKSFTSIKQEAVIGRLDLRSDEWQELKPLRYQSELDAQRISAGQQFDFAHLFVLPTDIDIQLLKFEVVVKSETSTWHCSQLLTSEQLRSDLIPAQDLPVLNKPR